MSKSLPIKYFSQLDNGKRAANTCNTSACWMAALYLNPTLWAKCEQDDNADFNFYLPLVEDDPYDCTTDHSSQTEALESLGVKSTWRTDYSLEACKKEIDEGRPVVIGLLHRGHVTAPKGGGHMILIIGYDEMGYIVHDPNGDLDLVNGGYPNWNSGANLHYSHRNLSRRSELDASNRYTPDQNLWCRTFQTNRPS